MPMIFLVAASCTEQPPRGQVLLFVDTDAPVVSTESEGRSLEEPLPLFDRLSVELIAPGEVEPCANCREAFAITEEDLLAVNLSFGVLPELETTGYRVRLRMYWSGHLRQEEPHSRTAIEATVELPPVDDGEVVTGHVVLRTDHVGQPSEPVTMAPGRPLVSLVGTWPQARRTACSVEVPEGQACVPGGAFWMSHPALPGGAGLTDAPMARLAVVEPFLIDTSEVTVGRAREWLSNHDEDWPSADYPDPVPWSGEMTNLLGVDDYCTMSPDLTDDSRDGLPLNCVSYERARQICASRSDGAGDLPTEVQLEYVAGAMRGWRYPWGDAEPGCEDAVFARAGYAVSPFNSFSGECLEVGGDAGAWSSEPKGLDVVAVEESAVVDLAGNLAELARDDWAPQDSPCWRPSLVDDAPCVADEADGRVVRSGSWASAAYELRALFRARAPDELPTMSSQGTHLGPLVGFRCVGAGL